VIKVKSAGSRQQFSSPVSIAQSYGRFAFFNLCLERVRSHYSLRSKKILRKKRNLIDILMRVQADNYSFLSILGVHYALQQHFA